MGDRVTGMHPGIGEVAGDRAEFASFFDGLEVLEPGIVSCAHWRAGGSAPEVARFGAVARKP